MQNGVDYCFKRRWSWSTRISQGMQPPRTHNRERDSFIYSKINRFFLIIFWSKRLGEKANEILDHCLNAAMKFELSARRQIKIAHIKKIEYDGTTLTYVSAYDVIPPKLLEITKINKDGKEEIRNAADPVITFFKLTQSEPKLAKICQYINQDCNSWSTLYKIYEVIKADKSNHLKKMENIIKRRNSSGVLRITRHPVD